MKECLKGMPIHCPRMVIFVCSMFIHLQNFGIDQSFTQRYVAARSRTAQAIDFPALLLRLGFERLSHAAVVRGWFRHTHTL